MQRFKYTRNAAVRIIRDFSTGSENKYFIQVCLVNIILLGILLTGRNSRNITLELRSNFFENNSQTKLVFIVVAFAIFSIIAFFLPHFAITFNNLSKYNRKYLVLLPTFSFLTCIVIPTYHKYFSGQAVFTDLQYTIQFILDESVQNVSDKNLVYPSSFLWIRKLSFLNEQMNSSFYLSIIATLGFLFCVINFSKQLENFSILIFSALLVSPPIKWLFESQNLDLFIIILLYFISFIYLDNPGFRNTFGILALSSIALIKLYTIPILFFLFLISKSKLSRLQLGLSLCILMPVLFLDTSNILKLIPIAADNNAIGVRVILYFLGFQSSYLSLLSLTLGVILYAVIFVFAMLRKDSTVRKNIFDSNIYVYSMIIFTLFMIVTSNYQYRMVFLVFMIPLIFSQFSSRFDLVAASFAFVSFFCYTRSLGFLSNIFLLPILISSLYSLSCMLLQNHYNRNK